MSETTIVKPFIQTHKTCDNHACVNWHGVVTPEGAPRLYAKTELPQDKVTAEGNQFQLGPYTYTVCRVCEHAVDSFFHLYKTSQHKTPPKA